jgi:hypothetical protein
MLHLLHYPREIIAERVVFTPADQAQIALCRGPHNRLGFAYQMGFLRLTDRFPTQQPLEILDDLLAFVAHELAIDPAAIQDYAQRQATVSAHQDHIRFQLGFRPFDAAARDALNRFLLEEATCLEHTPAFLARAEEFLRNRRILLPALSTLRRLAGEQREQARIQVYARMMACVPPELPPRLDALLHVDADAHFSPLQLLKAPPKMPSPRALSRQPQRAALDQQFVPARPASVLTSSPERVK